MAVKTKRGLGRGLDSLIPAGESKKEETKAAPIIKEERTVTDLAKQVIKITKVEPNHEQPRKQFDEDALAELAESIKQVGILEPLLVRSRDDHFEIIAGERRWRAARAAGVKEVPVVIRNDLTDQQIVEIQLIENIQRENLNPIEEANAYVKIMDNKGLTQEEFSKIIGKSQSYINNTIGLLRLPPEVKDLLVKNKISMTHARILSKISDHNTIINLANKVVNEGMSVRTLEELSQGKDIPKVQKVNRHVKEENQEYKYLENNLCEYLGTKVKLYKNKMEIKYENINDLNRILDILKINNWKK